MELKKSFTFLKTLIICFFIWITFLYCIHFFSFSEMFVDNESFIKHQDLSKEVIQNLNDKEGMEFLIFTKQKSLSQLENENYYKNYDKFIYKKKVQFALASGFSDKNVQSSRLNIRPFDMDLLNEFLFKIYKTDEDGIYIIKTWNGFPMVINDKGHVGTNLRINENTPAPIAKFKFENTSNDTTYRLKIADTLETNSYAGLTKTESSNGNFEFLSFKFQMNNNTPEFFIKRHIS